MSLSECGVIQECIVIHAVRSTRSLLYTLQMSVADKLKCYVSIITVAASLLLLLCYFNFTGNIGVPQLEMQV